MRTRPSRRWGQRRCLWQKYSPWFYAGDTTEDCPPLFGEYPYCYRNVQFLSKGGEYYWRSYNGTIQRTWVALATTYRYQSCYMSCGLTSSWTTTSIPKWCGSIRKVYGLVSGVEQFRCWLFWWPA